MIVLICAAKVLAVIIIVIAGVLWECYGRYPNLKAIRDITLAETLKAHERVATHSGVSVAIEGKTFSYRFNRKYHGDVAVVILTITLKGSVLRKEKVVLTAKFRDESVETWMFEDGKERVNPDYPEQYALINILRATQNTANFDHADPATIAAYHNYW